MRCPILKHLRRGELVYDPFLGSGTTLAAAELAERVCYGMELDPKYVDVVVERWQTLTCNEATLDGESRTFNEGAEIRRREQVGGGHAASILEKYAANRSQRWRRERAYSVTTGPM